MGRERAEKVENLFFGRKTKYEKKGVKSSHRNQRRCVPRLIDVVSRKTCIVDMAIDTIGHVVCRQECHNQNRTTSIRMHSSCGSQTTAPFYSSTRQTRQPSSDLLDVISGHHCVIARDPIRADSPDSNGNLNILIKISSVVQSGFIRFRIEFRMK